MMVWSASSINSLRAFGNSTEMVTKQLMYAIIGLASMLLVARLSRDEFTDWLGR